MKHELTQEPSTGTKTVYHRAGRWLALALASLGVGGAVPSGLAQTAWNGNASTDWFDAGNWSAGVPTAGDTANINSATANAIVQGGSAVANRVDINSGKLLVGNFSSGVLNVEGRVFIGPSGALQLNNGSTLSLNSLEISIGGTYLDTADDQLVLTGSNPGMAIASGATTINSLISGTNGLAKTGVGTLILANDNIYTGGTTISQGTIQVGTGGTSGSLGFGDVTNNGTLSFNRSDEITFTNAISGAGIVRQAGGGKLILTADNTYSGGTAINGGTVQVGDGGATGSLGSGNITNNSVLAYNLGVDVTVANNISGAGSFQQIGTNTITFTGTNTYTGTTTISSNGAIRVGDGGTTGTIGSGAIINDGGLVFDRSDTLTVSGGISGSGNVTNVGGTTILTGAGSYSGLTVIEAGTLQIGNGGNTGSIGTNEVINNGMLAFNRTNNLTIANRISGTGGLTHAGSGALTLSGTNTYSGGTTVDGGGTLALVNAEALGSGDFNLANGKFQASSQLSTGLVINVGGNYLQGTDGTLELGVGGGNAASNQFDQIKIAGSATLDGTLHVTSFGNYRATHGDQIDLLVATGGITGTFSTFTNDIERSVLLTEKLTYDSDRVWLGWDHMSFVSFLSSSNVTLTANQQAVAVSLDTILTSTATNDVALINHLDYLVAPTNSLSAALPEAFDQIAPEELTAMIVASFSAMDAQGNQFLKRVGDLQSNYRRLYQNTLGRKTTTKAAFEAYVNKPWDLYFELPVNSASVAGDANAGGYDLSSGGFSVGADGWLGENLIVGGGINYLQTSADLDHGGSVDVDTLSAQVYATWFNASGLHFEGMIGAGINSYDTARQAVGGVASGSTDGLSFTTLFGGGYNWENGPWQFGPSLEFQYMNASIDEFTESGSLSPLRIASQSEDAAHSQLGFNVRYRHQVADSWTVIMPEFSLAWRHDFFDNAIALDSQFASGAGSNFTVTGPELGSESVIIGLGCSVQWKPELNTYLNLTLQRGRDGYDSQFLNLGLRYSF